MDTPPIYISLCNHDVVQQFIQCPPYRAMWITCMIDAGRDKNSYLVINRSEVGASSTMIRSSKAMTMPLISQGTLYSQLSPPLSPSHNLILPRLCSFGTRPTIFLNTNVRMLCQALRTDHDLPVTRRTANYQPNMWDYNCIQSLTNGFDVPTDSTSLIDTLIYASLIY